MGLGSDHEDGQSASKSRLREFFNRGKSASEGPGSRIGTVKTSSNDGAQYLSEAVELYAETKVSSAVLSVSVSRSGVLVGCDDGNIFLMTADLAVVRSFHGAHRGSCTRVEWHNDGIHFLSSGSDRTVRVWSLNNGVGNLLLSIPHSCEVTAACFDPRCVAISDQQLTSVWLFTCGLDNRLRFWRGSLLEQYESLGPTVVPVYLKTSEKVLDAVFVGTSDGRVLIFNFVHNSFSFVSEILVRNRHGKFAKGAAVCGLQISDSGKELLVSTLDHRMRILGGAATTVGAGGHLEAVGKFKGQMNAGGLGAGFGGFWIGGGRFIVSGSDCGNVLVWPRETSEIDRTSEQWECFLASEKPDKLTAVSPAPWNPENSEALPLCVVVGTMEGFVRVFYNRGTNRI